MGDILSLPRQPGLRSFIVYDELPVDCGVFEVKDMAAAPHLTAGEFAIIDQSDRQPMHGELFLMQWSSGRQAIVEVRRDPDGLWTVFYNLWHRSLDGSQAKAVRWSDGPYPADVLAEKLQGRVAGIYEPDFRHLLLAA